MNSRQRGAHLLSIQYRMHPEISLFPSREFYGGKLTDADTMEQKCCAPWHQDPLFAPYLFYNAIDGREQQSRGHSLSNDCEARLCCRLVEGICASNKSTSFFSRIGIITFYKGQVCIFLIFGSRSVKSRANLLGSLDKKCWN